MPTLPTRHLRAGIVVAHCSSTRSPSRSCDPNPPPAALDDILDNDPSGTQVNPGGDKSAQRPCGCYQNATIRGDCYRASAASAIEVRRGLSTTDCSAREPSHCSRPSAHSVAGASRAAAGCGRVAVLSRRQSEGGRPALAVDDGVDRGVRLPRSGRAPEPAFCAGGRTVRLGDGAVEQVQLARCRHGRGRE